MRSRVESCERSTSNNNFGILEQEEEVGEARAELCHGRVLCDGEFESKHGRGACESGI